MSNDGYVPGPRPSQRDGDLPCRARGCLAPPNSYGQCSIHAFSGSDHSMRTTKVFVRELSAFCVCQYCEKLPEHEPKDDPIRPKHYKGDLVMRILEAFGLDEDFNLGNVIKYILRHGEKAGLQDLLKARWYLERAIAKREGKLPEKLI